MNLITNIIDDCLSVKGVPTATAGAILSRVMGKRHQLLREVIAAEFRQDNFDRADEDEIVSICYRLIRDAEEGVAKNNLRLMARVINGMAEKNELKAPSFLRYAPILANLTEEEIQVLVILSKLSDTEIKYSMGYQQFTEAGIKNYHEVLQSLLRTALVRMEVLSGQDEDDKERINTAMRFYLTSLAREILKYAGQSIKKEAA